jgi:malate dehydrogenase
VKGAGVPNGRASSKEETPRSVFTLRDVEQASGSLRIGPLDVVTPLALDRAKELGITIERDGASGPPQRTMTSYVSPALVQRPVSQPAQRGVLQQPARTTPAGPARVGPGLPRVAQAAAPSGSAALPRSGALYRRSAYGSAGERNVRAGQTDAALARPQVTVVGAGHVGASAGFALALADRFARVRLIDVVEGLAEGLALDMWHSAGLRGFDTRVEGSHRMADVAGSDVIVITAGRPRKPGMSRTDLTAANSEIVRSIAPSIKELAPNAVVVVVTNPLEEMTQLVCELTAFPPERVVGMGGVLDTARFRALVGLTGAVRAQDVRALVLGSHGAEMVIPLSQATANNVPLEQLLDSATLDGIVRRTRESGAEVTKLLQSGSAFFSPGSAISKQVQAIVDDSDEVIPACVRSRGAYGLIDTRVGLPVLLGRTGVRRIVDLALRPAERAELAASAKAIDERIKAMPR